MTHQAGDATKLRRREIIGIGLAQVLIIFAILMAGLQLWRIDLSVPFQYWGDTIWFTVPIKGMIDNGWVYTIPQLSAPFTLSAAAFPSMTHTDWLVMKIISLFTAEPGAVPNVFWICSLIFAAWSATLALSLLGVRIWLAAVVGLIYAFLPFALLRNVAHISLVYHFVPLLSLLVIWIAQGCIHPNSRQIRWVGYIAAAAQGFNYIYYGFFTLLLLAFSGWFGMVRTRSWRPIKQASLAGLLILVSASINLAPSFVSWHAHGKPPDMAYKSSAEAEIYGLKIRKMLAPNEANQIPFLSHWGQRDKSVAFPNENENVTARLGPMGAAGLMLIFMVILGLIRLHDNPESETVKPVAALSIFAVLVATVGGLGAIFNLVFPEFRTYNRISVFIGFFALAAFALWWQSEHRVASSNGKRLLLGVGLAFLVLISLYDQLLDLRHLSNQRTEQEVQTWQLRALVKQVEAVVPPGSSVFQLPITGFPPDGGREQMGPYAHGQAYLASTSLHWSWPSFSQRHRAWQDKLNGLEASQFVEALALSRFRLVWIDRFGYADNGEQIVSALIAAGATELLSSAHSRYVILDLQTVINLMRTSLGDEDFERSQRDYIDAPALHWGKGFYPLEHNPDGRPFRWAQGESELVIRNWSNTPRSFELSFWMAAGKPGSVTIFVDGRRASTTLSAVPVQVTIPVHIGANDAHALKFTSDMGRGDLPPGETRDLHFYVMDMRLRPTPISVF
jgi:phosphoglycerol transferase